MKTRYKDKNTKMFPTQASVAIVTGNISNFISFYIRPLGTVTREKSLGQGLRWTR